jgi:ribosomal protein S18 acetylase RimI-like enzyme
MPLQFRLVVPGDKASLIELGLIAYGAFREQVGPEQWQTLESGLSNEENWKKLISISTGFVSVQDERVVGMAFIVPGGNPWDVFESDWSYIRLVGVHPAFQGRGIARALTRLCIDHARKSGERTIALHTSEMMDAARHLYESLGFRILREIPNRYGKKYWLYTLQL